jgi:hypothetical protein
MGPGEFLLLEKQKNQWARGVENEVPKRSDEGSN